MSEEIIKQEVSENESAKSAAEEIKATADKAENEAEEANQVRFADLGLSEEVYKAVVDLGFETPSKIQERAIPVFLEGRDLIGQAQTGTGKTAAFALPLLSMLDPSNRNVQALVLTPTRELAIQIAEACQSFAKYLPDFHILPIYGGSSYETQIKALRRGVQIVVGTPGRVMDLMNKGKLVLDGLHHVVLDEADEMLNMGFIDDIEWILQQCPEQRKIALFSATMPQAIRRVAVQYLKDPEEIRIAAKTQTASTVRQRFWYVSGLHKVDAMARLLEVEPYEAVLVFVKTKNDAEDVSRRLSARGLAADALHGDIPQKLREKIVDKLKTGQIDIVVATDVAARGLDVDRITHVVNYEIPYDVESYVHRIGRTGRAGRKGDAILFVSPRDRRMLRTIEQVTGQKLEPMLMPTNEDINRHRIESFKEKIMTNIAEFGEELLESYTEVVNDILGNDDVDPVDLCSVLACMANGNGPLFLDPNAKEPEQKMLEESSGGRRERGERGDRPSKQVSATPVPLKEFPDIEMRRYRLAVGHTDGVKPGQIVGAIANEAGLDSCYIGQIDIYNNFTTIDLPVVPEAKLREMTGIRICGRACDIREYTETPPARGERRGKPFGGRDRGERRGGRGGDRFRDRDDGFDRQESRVEGMSDDFGGRGDRDFGGRDRFKPRDFSERDSFGGSFRSRDRGDRSERGGRDFGDREGGFRGRDRSDRGGFGSKGGFRGHDEGFRGGKRFNDRDERGSRGGFKGNGGFRGR